jgi:hypothetical protein
VLQYLLCHDYDTEDRLPVSVVAEAQRQQTCSLRFGWCLACKFHRENLKIEEKRKLMHLVHLMSLFCVLLAKFVNMISRYFGKLKLFMRT